LRLQTNPREARGKASFKRRIGMFLKNAGIGWVDGMRIGTGVRVVEGF
jgi:hypothetical protein